VIYGQTVYQHFSFARLATAPAGIPLSGILRSRQNLQLPESRKPKLAHLNFNREKHIYCAFTFSEINHAQLARPSQGIQHSLFNQSGRCRIGGHAGIFCLVPLPLP
jgi:hypothetical protein